ncbi:hypothetical protein ASPZODRAFT_373557 [Penicilliopsis zonata CBS 506.65]|uniref:Uncharacterized protein n=1 Tax=Penicilliopsis zonata CBS 506.65 TaxID=1073090 RepID=A0A1L9SVZ6_9EURO|nr:hypothetical protein ASPZODRAFT_373557 [Penicilliopsis zonata CBS 506.65]OJJ51372.1 hypothetical protein ASPZODRAFT_373557 [Penicilliopsis zonata CBS 506.65]
MTMVEPEEWGNAPDGSALPWILDHVLRYPGSYELPLRTMYSLNCNPTSQSHSQPGSTYPETAFTARSSMNSTKSSTSTSSQGDAAAQFKAQLVSQISRLPSQPCSLPPSFVTSFLRRCFALQIEEVDFPQALTGLDYLKDLENRRRKDVVSALQRLGIQRDDLDQKAELGKQYPGVLSWIEAIEDKEKKIEALYTQVYVGLRRWTLINEMLLEPYNKANCIAMLNTLFPPVTEATVAPTVQLTPHILKSQRDGFFRYITSIDTNGKQILDKVIMQGAREGDENGWPLVREALDKYLRAANEIIDECTTVNDPNSVTADPEIQKGDRKGRKVDSGISFGSSERLACMSSNNSSSIDIHDKPLPPSPTRSKTGSALERLAREIRKLGDAGKVKNHSDEVSYFDVDEQKRKRLIWEATNRKKNHTKQSSQHSR